MIFQIAGKRFEIDRDRIVSATERLQPNPTDRRKGGTNTMSNYMAKSFRSNNPYMR